MNEEQRNLIESLNTSIKSVYNEERFLLRFADGDRAGLEQAFVFRTGIYLSRLMENTPYRTLDLDSEYNKNHGNVKSSRRFANGLRPDLILHRRDSNKENKLVVEFKGWWNNNIKDDLSKLEDLTSPHDKYNYLLGVFVHIGRESADFRYFLNGHEYE